MAPGDEELVDSARREQAVEVQVADEVLTVPPSATLETMQLSVIEKNINETKQIDAIDFADIQDQKYDHRLHEFEFSTQNIDALDPRNSDKKNIEDEIGNEPLEDAQGQLPLQNLLQSLDFSRCITSQVQEMIQG